MVLEYFLIMLGLAIYITVCICLTNWFDKKYRLKQACKLYEAHKSCLQSDERECVEYFLNVAAINHGKKPPYPVGDFRPIKVSQPRLVEVVSVKQLPGKPGLLRRG